MTSLRWIGGRLLSAVLVVLGALTVSFLGLHLAGGDPVDTMVGGNSVTPDVVRSITEEDGFDKPLVVQYLLLLSRLVRGTWPSGSGSGDPPSSIPSGPVPVISSAFTPTL